MFIKLLFNSFNNLFPLFILITAILCSCGKENNSRGVRGGISSPIFNNITILLDLSDRDLSNNTTKPSTDIPIKHDTTAIRIVLSKLKETFRTLTIKDRVTVERVHQDNANYEEYYASNYHNLQIDMEKVFDELKKQNKTALSIPVRKKEFDARADKLINCVSELENISRQNSNPVGGDITKFLKENGSQFFRNDYDNILIILTDGREKFNFKRDQIVKLAGQYSNLKILMLGLNVPNSSKSPGAIEDIKKNWINKFVSIGVFENDIIFNEVKDINLIEMKIKGIID